MPQLELSKAIAELCQEAGVDIQSVRLVDALPSVLLQAVQRGETCKLAALSALIDCFISKKECSLRDQSIFSETSSFLLRIPLYKNGETHHPGSLRSLAKKLTGSQVGEMYSVDSLVKTAGAAGVALSAEMAATTREYISRLKSKILNDHIPTMVVFNVHTNQDSMYGQPDVTKKENINEHAAIVLGYFFEDEQECFIVHHWGKCWIFDAEMLAESALSLCPNDQPEIFTKIQSLDPADGRRSRWVNSKFFEESLRAGYERAAEPERASDPVMREESSLRGVLFSIEGLVFAHDDRLSPVLPR